MSLLKQKQIYIIIVMVKYFKILTLIILFIPALLYLVLIAIVEWDRLESKYLAPEMPSVVVQTKTPQKITLLNSGVAALWARLELIASAEKSIEIEYFIYDLDQTAKLVTQALLKKAAQGIKVRVIVDFSAPIFKLNSTVAAFMKQKGVEVKYYNTASLHKIFSVQHRSHRKLLVIDDKIAITGGRNVANDYFEISEHYNFYDSDIIIEGDIVQSMKKSFEQYWNSTLAMASEKFETEFSQAELTNALNFLHDDPILAKLKQRIQSTGEKILANELKTTCTDSIYAADHPGTSVAARKVYSVLIQEAALAKNKIEIESPYFVLKNDGLKDFKKLIDLGVKVSVLTNTLYSTDAYYTVSAFAATLVDLNSAGLVVYGFSGAPKAKEHLIPDLKVSDRWGLHAKRGVIDEKTTLIGTYNIDPRSANFNSEMIFICRNNPELAQAVLMDMHQRLKNSEPLVQNNCVNCFKNLIQGADWLAKLKFFIFIPIASRLDFLL